MQIKTIVTRLDDVRAFDRLVNVALKEGWTLEKREVLQQGQPISDRYYRSMLYAELSKEEDHETKKD